MSVSYNGPVRVYKRRGSNTTNDGSPQTNLAGLALGDNTGAVTCAKQVWAWQPTAAAGVMPLYQVGIGGAVYTGPNGNSISIPPGTPTVIATVPAGASTESIFVLLEQAPTAITAGALTFAYNGQTIGTYTVGTTISAGMFTFPTTMVAMQYLSDTGPSDAVFTATLSGTGITGGLLARISINYTVRNADGSIIPYGQGLTNDGTNSPQF